MSRYKYRLGRNKQDIVRYGGSRGSKVCAICLLGHNSGGYTCDVCYLSLCWVCGQERDYILFLCNECHYEYKP